MGPFHLALTEGCGYYTTYSITPCDASSHFEWQQKQPCRIYSVAKTIRAVLSVSRDLCRDQPELSKHAAYVLGRQLCNCLHFNRMHPLFFHLYNRKLRCVLEYTVLMKCGVTAVTSYA